MKITENEQRIQAELKAQELLAEQEFQESLLKLEADPTSTFLEEIYKIPKHFAKMVALGYANGMFLYGESGIGKTFSVKKAFMEAKTDFRLLSGHITSLEFYNYLYEHRAENIILDDVNILENEKNLNILKAILSDTEPRIVQYHTTSTKLKVPEQFVFSGRVIVLLNNIPKDTNSLQAVKSRILNYELKLDYKTKIKIILELSRKEYKELTDTDRKLIYDFIKSNTSEATKNMNLRLLFQLYEVYRYDKNNWIEIAERLIDNDVYLQWIVQGLTQKDWCERTGLSRPSYYLYKQKLNGLYERTAKVVV